MATWNQTAPGRWKLERVDEKGKKRGDRHILIARGDRLVELHDRTVHIYRVNGPINDANPLDGAELRRTLHRKDLAGGRGKTDKQAATALEDLAAEPVPDTPGRVEPDPE